MKKLKTILLILLTLFSFSTTILADDDSENEKEGVRGPTIGTAISNQAAVRYIGYDNEKRNLKSNIVITYVAQIYALTFVPDQSVTAVPGDVVYFNHTLRNLGNGKDTFTLTNTYVTDPNAANYQYSYFISYDDDDDKHENYLELKAPYNVTLESGKSVSIRVVVDTDENATPNSTVFHNVRATSKGDSTQYAEVKETIKYTQDAAVTVIKSFDKYSGYRLTDQVLTIGMEIINTSPTAARTFVLTDTLDSKFKYVAGTDIYWRDFNGTTSTKLTAGTEYTFGNRKVKFFLTTDSAGKTVVNFQSVSTVTGDPTTNPSAVAVPGNITSGKGSGYLTFKVTVSKGTALSLIPNYANYSYFDGTDQQIAVSNTVYYRVLPTRNVVITPNNTGYVYIGGTALYSHTVTNYGDVTEGDETNSTFTLIPSNSKGGWVSNIYLDTNHNNMYDTTIDQVFSGFQSLGGLAPGDSVVLFVKVTSPTTALVNDTNITTLTANINQGIYYLPAVYTAAVTDTTIVQGDYLTIDKYQSIDPVDGNYSKNDKKIKPGALIYYKIVAKNNSGNMAAKGIVLTDLTPVHTTLAAGTGNVPGMNYLPSYIIKDKNGNIKQNFKLAELSPIKGGTGTVQANLGNLDPGDSAILYFNVKIDS